MNDNIPARLLLPLLLYPITALTASFASVPLVIESHTLLDVWGAGVVLALISLGLVYIGFLAVQKETEKD